MVQQAEGQITSYYDLFSSPSRRQTLHESRNAIYMFLFFMYKILEPHFFPLAVMEYQVQINSVKSKLQETRARKKQQEELIMKVENQALKVSSTHTFHIVIQNLGLHVHKHAELEGKCLHAA